MNGISRRTPKSRARRNLHVVGQLEILRELDTRFHWLNGKDLEQLCAI